MQTQMHQHSWLIYVLMQKEVAGVGIQMFVLCGMLPRNKYFICHCRWNVAPSLNGGCPPGNVREVCFDSCNTSSLIPQWVLGVMVCIQCFVISDFQGWPGVGVKRKTVFNPFSFRTLKVHIQFKGRMNPDMKFSHYLLTPVQKFRSPQHISWALQHSHKQLKSMWTLQA